MSEPTIPISEDTGNETSQLSTPSGGTISVVYTTRIVQQFNITKSEMKTVSNLNTFAIIAFSAGSSFLSLLTAVLIGRFFSNGITADQNHFSMVLAWLFGLLMAFFYSIGFYFWVSRNSYIDDIEKESAKD